MRLFTIKKNRLLSCHKNSDLLENHISQWKKKSWYILFSLVCVNEHHHPPTYPAPPIAPFPLCKLRKPVPSDCTASD